MDYRTESLIEIMRKHYLFIYFGTGSPYAAEADLKLSAGITDVYHHAHKGSII
jgi:hypothetical protein